MGASVTVPISPADLKEVSAIRDAKNLTIYKLVMKFTSFDKELQNSTQSIIYNQD